MKSLSLLVISFLLFNSFLNQAVFAGVEGSIHGTVEDSTGIAVDGAKISVLNSQKKIVKAVTTSATGEFDAFPIDFGDYSVKVEALGFAPTEMSVHVASGGTSNVKVELSPSGKEISIQVKAAKKQMSREASSSREINHEAIEALPQGDDIKLPKLLAETNPGIVQGPFGQTFIRGNHANIQYQIDGVQLPDSPSNTFGQAFSPRNIDHMEVITGGVPAEYGERLAAVVNIITKSGAETPNGNLEVGYGSYNTFTPQMLYSGSNPSGDFHYYFSAAYTSTSRGLDTPQPTSTSNVTQGGNNPTHDDSNGNDEFMKLDWQLGNMDKITVVAYNSYSYFQIPNFPSSFSPTNPPFKAGYTDQFGNGPVNYVPADTNDTQAENNAYIQAVWKHSVDAHSFFQLSPYFKFSKINVTNDPTNDLYAASSGVIPGALSSSFSENRSTNNFGLKGDYSLRINDRNLLKAGFQAQASKSYGSIFVISEPQGSPALSSSDNSDTVGDTESIYVQDELKIVDSLTLNAGLRGDATQFKFSDASSNDSWLQPRIGLTYLASETTKLHAFYGLLFQPAPAENLRDTFVTTGAGSSLTPYDIKAEKDNYYEVGISQQVGGQVLNLNTYYKSAKNMLDDAQLLNTSIAQPYNFAQGYAYGVEFSVTGKITEDWSDYFNYSYEIAKGKDISGGLFAFPAGTSPNTGGYQFLDHVQVHTANAGVTYKKDRWSWTGVELFGSGLRTGVDNTESLPDHFSTDTTVTYDFSGESFWSKAKLALDIVNVFDNEYAITIANGFNGSHYASGREFFVRLSKDF